MYSPAYTLPLSNNLLQTKAPTHLKIHMILSFVRRCTCSLMQQLVLLQRRPLSPQRLRPSPIVSQQPPTILRHLRKLLSFPFRRGTVLPAQNGEPYDPLHVCPYVLYTPAVSLIVTSQVPATSSRHQYLSHSVQGTTEVHSGMTPDENVSVRSSSLRNQRP
jgi:hypothetical protein